MAEKLPDWMTEADDRDETPAPAAPPASAPAPAPKAEKMPGWMTQDQSSLESQAAMAVANDPKLRGMAMSAAQDPRVQAAAIKHAKAELANDPNTPSWVYEQDTITDPSSAAALGKPLLGDNGMSGEKQKQSSSGCMWPCVVLSLMTGIGLAIWTVFIFSMLQACPTESMRSNRIICLAAQLLVIALAYYDYKAERVFHFKFIWSILFLAASITMSIIMIVDAIPVAAEAHSKTGSCSNKKLEPALIPIGDAFLCFAWGALFMVLRKVESSTS